MAQNIQALGLSLIRQLSSSRIVQKYHLQDATQKLAFTASKNGFRLLENLFAKWAKNKPAGQAPKQLFDLSLTQEQQMIKDSLTSYAQEVMRPLAQNADDSAQLPADFMAQSTQLGLNYFAVPTEFGGTAEHDSPTTNAIISEALAYGDMSLAYAALAPFAVVNAIVKWGTLAQKHALLPDYLSDKPIKSAIAIQENSPLFNPYKLNTSARKKGTGFELTGTKSMVPFAGTASQYLVAAMYQKKPRLFVLNVADCQGLKWRDAPAMGLKACELGQLKLDKVLVPLDALLGSEDVPFNYQALLALGGLQSCALAVGSAQAALDYALNYANERQAFGEPISHRQSVAFMLADIATELDAMRLMCWRAAALAEQGKDFHQAAFLAQHFCGEKAMQIATDVVQILGGHGFTKEHPAERWYRDLRAIGCVQLGLHL